MKHRRSILILVLVVGLVCGWSATARASTPQQSFTAEELARYNGKDGAKAYYAYEGVVYDVTDSAVWKLGKHFGHEAGQDLTGKLEGAPHGDDIVKKMPVVGVFVSAATISPSPISATPQPVATSLPQQKPWYANRIRILGISITGWTGILLGFFFPLNFATCFAFPWSKFSLPWKGARPGHDTLDTVPTHQRWASIHKYFAWGTVIVGLVHGLLGLMQVLFGIYL